MLSEDALRFLLLKHLWKHRLAVDPSLHAEVARSLTVALPERGGPYLLAWSARGVAGAADVPADSFRFYQRGDVAELAPRADAANEQAARLLAAQMLGVDPLAAGAPASLALSLDTWRWPLICGIGAVAALLASRSVFSIVLTAVAVFETRVRVRWMYLVLLAVVVLDGHTITASVLALALAAGALGSSAAFRDWPAAVAALALAAAGAYRRPPQPVTSDSVYLAVVTLVALVAFVMLWLSFDGQRVSTLLAPLLIVPLLLDGQPALSVTVAIVCISYLAWLSILRRQDAASWLTH